MLRILSFYSTLIFLVSATEIEKPHILFISADDLGWNDVSFHGSDQIMTPNIDILGLDGIILDQYYTDCQGAASMSSLFTGKYAMRLGGIHAKPRGGIVLKCSWGGTYRCLVRDSQPKDGTQGPSIAAAEDRGIPSSEILLPSLLRELGYSTNLFGKWQLGNSREKFLPMERGFDNFFGFTTYSVDYFTYNHAENVNGSTYHGLDFFRNWDPIENQKGYITDVLTDEVVKFIRNHDTSQPLYIHLSHAAPHIGGGLVNLQAPEDAIDENNHIAHTSRRLYAGMVTALDKSIGHVVGALAEREVLNNTIIIFVSDNGAPSVGLSSNFGSNWPLRGSKGSPWEGAVRSIGLIWHASFTPQIRNDMFHVTDWLPTLVAAAGGNITETKDGVNHWNVLVKDEKPKRHNALITMDDLEGWAAFREGDFKIILGEVNEAISQYYGENLIELRHSPPSYENTLLNAETMHVFKETLKRSIDINRALEKRKNMTLVSNKTGIVETSCIPTRKQGCLYNITADPSETNDLWSSLPEIVRHMTLRVRFFWGQICPRRQVHLDERSHPALHNFVWLPWITSDEKELEPLTVVPEFPLKMSIGDIKYYVDLNMKSFSDNLTFYVKNMADVLIASVSNLFSF